MRAILSILLLFGCLAAVMVYYAMDHSPTGRNRPLMRLIRGTIERVDLAFNNALRATGLFIVRAVVVIVGAVVVLALSKWSLEELAR